MFLTQRSWSVDDRVAIALSAPFHPWKSIAFATTEPKFLVEFGNSYANDGGFRYLLVSGVETLAQMGVAPGTVIDSVHYLSCEGRCHPPVLDALWEIRRISSPDEPAQYAYRREDGTWSGIGQWPITHVVPFEHQTVVFALRFGPTNLQVGKDASQGN
ncbi:hypothetical protein PPMP20_09090 [Paraburkholderia phymatum]|uniref:Uncharacterized protein n=1 Tax=Paraburkholderia phymatum (strain DSM 17167 / CIP 108236 / LMG 21445 / STM815) TaxID=391038 RepID=B2JC82_PARP8|nr:hypothetical protein [Paraburkholderia phymatum]ACC69446.1 hypothetical protein Bphy_0253 [Paraburkholderia phymatum STM815]